MAEQSELSGGSGRLWDEVFSNFPTPNGVKSLISRTHSHRPVEIVPHLKTDDELYVRWVYALVAGLRDTLVPSDEAAVGFEYPAVPPGLDRLFSAQGMLPEPSGTPFYDARRIGREVAESRSKVDPRWQKDIDTFAESLELIPEDAPLFTQLLSRLLQTSGPRTVPINRLSTVGLPQMTKNPEVKVALGAKWIEQGKLLTQLVDAADYRTLYNEGILFMYFNGYRTQVDRTVLEDGKRVPGKERIVVDWKGNLTTMDKRLTDPHLRDRMVAIRTRSFAVFSMGGSFPWRVVGRSVENAMYENYPEVFKHRSPDAVAYKLKDAVRIRMFDVTQHDQSMPAQVIDLISEAMYEKFPSYTARMFDMMIHGPILVHNDHLGGKGAVVKGDPLSANGYNAWYQNPSGNPLTSWIAKTVGFFYAYLACVRVGLVDRTTSDLDRVLDGRHPRVVILNLGDNLIVGGKDAEAASLLDELEAALYCAEFDESFSFSGWVPASSGGSVTWLPNILSYLMRWVAHDRSVSSPYRQYWASGWFERKIDYGNHPLFHEVDRKFNEITEKILGRTMDDIAEANRSDEPPLIAPDDYVSRLFRSNPDAVHYKLDFADLPDEVVRSAFVTFSDNDIAELYYHLTGEKRS